MKEGIESASKLVISSDMMFTDDQLITIDNMARHLDPYDRKAFVAAVHAYFHGRTEVGDGELGRALRELQQEHRKSIGRDYPTARAPDQCSWRIIL
jgi:hypothetical protein